MRFSVIVCTYNYAHLLPDALRSLAAQTFSDFELLVADDGSTDNTEDVVAHFQPRFHNCRYLKKPHTGLADTRNFAICAAQGSHIAFLDADDLWSPHYLSTFQEAFMANPEAGLTLCEGITFRTNGRVITEAELDEGLPPLCGPVRSAQDIFSVLNAFSPSGMVFTRMLHNQIGPFDVRFCEGLGDDIDWTVRALLAGVSCVCLKRRLYLYRRHNANLTNKASAAFRAWLVIYSQTLSGSRADPQIKALARAVIMSYLVRHLPACSKQERKVLIQSAIGTLGRNSGLRLYQIATHMGLVSLLRLFKRTKQCAHRLFRKELAIDLSGSPGAIFDALPK